MSINFLVITYEKVTFLIWVQCYGLAKYKSEGTSGKSNDIFCKDVAI